MKTVLHIVRKKSQLRAPFIRNQILSHSDYSPIVVFRMAARRPNEVGSRDIDGLRYPCLNLAENETPWEKLVFRVTRRITKRQASEIEAFAECHGAIILHFHYGSDAGIYVPLLKMTKRASVVSFYGYDCFSFPKRFLGLGRKYLRKRVFPYVKAVLAMSPEMKKDLLAIGCPEEKIRIHYHGVPSRMFSGMPERSERKRKNLVLFILSYLDPVKGHIFLFSALRVLLDRGIVSLELRIAGDGFYKPKLEAFVRLHGLQDSVRFLGSIAYNSPEFISEFVNADVFVHPSVTTRNDKEGIPGTVVEAMFAGLPVVSTRHGGIPHVIEHERTGLLVDEWDVGGLAAAIERLVENENLRLSLGSAARTFAAEQLGLERRQMALERLYDSVRAD